MESVPVAPLQMTAPAPVPLRKPPYPARRGDGFWSSARHAWAGLVHTVVYQPNMKVHVVSAILVGLVGSGLPLGLAEKVTLIFCVLLVFFAEILNSALETLVDLATQEFDEKARVTKDAAAAAVLVLSIGSAVIFAALVVHNWGTVLTNGPRIERQVLFGIPLAGCASLLMRDRPRPWAQDALAFAAGLVPHLERSAGGEGKAEEDLTLDPGATGQHRVPVVYQERGEDDGRADGQDQHRGGGGVLGDAGLLVELLGREVDQRLQGAVEDLGEEDQQDAEDQRDLLREAERQPAPHQPHQDGGDHVDFHVRLVHHGMDQAVPGVDRRGPEALAAAGRIRRLAELNWGRRGHREEYSGTD